MKRKLVCSKCGVATNGRMIGGRLIGHCSPCGEWFGPDSSLTFKAAFELLNEALSKIGDATDKRFAQLEVA